MLLIYSAFLFAFWLLLSGHFEPLMLGLGLASVGLTILLIKRMKLIDYESFPIHLTAKLPSFLMVVLREIIQANFDLMKRILAFKRSSISPQMIEVKCPLKTDLGRVIYANSITLTPGTLSVEMTNNMILVHTISEGTAKALSTGKKERFIPDDIAKGDM